MYENARHAIPRKRAEITEADVRAARDGGPAFEALWARVAGAASRHSFRLLGSWFAEQPDRRGDARQEALIALLEAVETWTPSKGSNFDTWFRWRLRGRLSRMRRTLAPVCQRPSRDGPTRSGNWHPLPSRQFLYVDAPRPLDDEARGVLRTWKCLATNDDPDAFVRASRLREIVGNMQLTPREARVLKHRLLADPPLTYREIGWMSGISHESVRTDEKSFIARLRAELKGLEP